MSSAPFRIDFLPMVPMIETPEEFFVDGIGAVEVIGPNASSIMYRMHVSDGGVIERVPVLILTRPLLTLPDTIDALQAVITHMPVPKPGQVLGKRPGH